MAIGPPLSSHENLSELVLFLGYSSEDEGLAQDFKSELENLGAQVRFSVRVGAKIEPSLRAGLKESHASVFLLSRAAVDSAWVMFEAGATWIVGKHRNPLSLDGLRCFPSNYF